MLLRSTLVLLECSQTGWSVVHQFSRRNLLFPKYHQVRHKNVGKSPIQPAPVHKPALSADSAPNSLQGLVSQLKIPILFTITASSVCLFAYDLIGNIVPERSHRTKTHFRWWHDNPDWLNVFTVLCGSCILVYLGITIASKLIPSSERFVKKYFILKTKVEDPLEMCLNFILSGFTHFNLWHLGLNMLVLSEVVLSAVPEIGKDKFLGCYFFSLILSSFLSYSCKMIRADVIGSIGSSGAVVGVFWMDMLRSPKEKIDIIFTNIQVSRPVAFLTMTAIEVLGLIKGWKYLDHAAHLGGLLGAITWQTIQTLKGDSQKTQKKIMPQEEEDW